MSKLLFVAKVTMSLVWLVLLINFFLPFAGKASIALYILAGFLLFMHALQLLIFLGAFGESLKLTTKEKLGILFYGIFELLAINKRRSAIDH